MISGGTHAAQGVATIRVTPEVKRALFIRGIQFTEERIGRRTIRVAGATRGQRAYVDVSMRRKRSSVVNRELRIARHWVIVALRRYFGV